MREISDIKAAVVGTGFIGVVHVEALRRLGVEVAGIVGSSPERAARSGLPLIERSSLVHCAQSACSRCQSRNRG